MIQNFTSHGLECQVKLMNLGFSVPGLPTSYYLGYVALPKGHPLHYRDYDSLSEAPAPGGLTYSAAFDSERSDPGQAGDWILGFDTMHYDCNYAQDEVMSMVQELAAWLIRYE